MLAVGVAVASDLICTVIYYYCCIHHIPYNSAAVLQYSCMTIWLMARDAGNRREVGVLWGVDGLVSLLQSNGSLKLKEVAVAALWLVSCDTDNAIRVALKVSAVIEHSCHLLL
jgi:hypothetical protein